MSDQRIKLWTLRTTAEQIGDGELLALVEAVEAAHEAIAIQREYQRSERSKGVAEWEWPTFARFDFGSRP